MDLAIEVRGLRKSYAGTPAVAGVDLAAAEGTVLGLLGPNGAGKTTLVRILATLVAPDGGSAIVAGHDVVRAPHAVRSRIALAGQYAGVDGVLTGRENLVLLGKLHHLGRAAAHRRAAELLERFGLAAAADRPTAGYSGGMRRRLDLACCLVVRPAVLFLDEPTTGLDPASRTELWSAVRELVTEGVTVLLTTQYLEEADQLASRVVVVAAGAVLAEGSPAQLKARAGVAHAEIVVAAADLSAAVRALTGPGGAPSVDHAAAVLSVPLRDGAADVTASVLALSAADVPVLGIAVREPSLDDAFLGIVASADAGRPASADAGRPASADVGRPASADAG